MSIFAAFVLFFQAIWSSIIGLFSSKWSVDNQPADIEAAIPDSPVETKEIVPTTSLPVNNLVKVIDNIAHDKDSKNLAEDDSKDEVEEKSCDTRISSKSSTSRYQPTRRQSLLLENIRKYAEDNTYDLDKEYDAIESVVISPEPELVVISGQKDEDCNSEAKRECKDGSLTSSGHLSPMSVSSKSTSLRSPKSDSRRNRGLHVQFEECPSQVQFTPLPERVSRKHREQRESRRIEMYDYLARVSDAQVQAPPPIKFALSHSGSVESIGSDASTESCYSQNSMVDDDSDSDETGGTSMPSTPDAMHRRHTFPDLMMPCNGSDSEKGDPVGENDLTLCTPESFGSVLCDPLPEVPIQKMEIGARSVTTTPTSESNCDTKEDESILLDTAKAHAREETLRKLLSSSSPPPSSSRCITPEPPLLLPACLFPSPNRGFQKAITPVVVKFTTTTPATDATIPPLKIVKKVKIVEAPNAEEGAVDLQASETEEKIYSCDKAVAESLDEAVTTQENVTQESATEMVGVMCSETSIVNGLVGVPTNRLSQSCLEEKRKRTAGLQPRAVVVPEGYF